MDGLHKIIENRFTKKVFDLDCKHGGEWLTLGVMLYSLLQTHGRYLSLQTILRQWMKNLASYSKEFSLMEKLHALWASSQSNSPVQDLISEKEKQNFTLAFKKRRHEMSHEAELASACAPARNPARKLARA